MNEAMHAESGAEARAEILTRTIGRTALEATLYEVAASPKPGLVDPVSAGAHGDMDYFTFLTSAATLAPYFIEFARLGVASESEQYVQTQAQSKGQPRVQGKARVRSAELLSQLRRVGLEAERAMFAATGGANTHKGLIFSMGLLCAAAGRLVGEEMVLKDAAGAATQKSAISESSWSTSSALFAENCARVAGSIVAGICERELAPLSMSAARTSGESLYVRFGVRGIRGEAEAGFPSVIERALPRLRADLSAGATYNDAMVDALLELCRCVDDTTVLNRAGFEGLKYVKAKAEEALARGGMLSERGKSYIRRLDKDFSARGLSPGGCADLLAVTVFLDRLPAALEHEGREWRERRE